MRGDVLKVVRPLMTHHALLFPSIPSLSSPVARTAAAAAAAAATRTAGMSTSSAAAAASVAQQKNALRAKVKKELKAMPPAQRHEEDITIQNIVLDSSWFKSCTSLCAYISCEALREVDTSRIVGEILSDTDADRHSQGKKKLYVPRMEKDSQMRMLNISSMEDLVANSMNILEPSPINTDGSQRQDVMQASDPIDLILVPGLAFDKHGRRLGRGKAYYDIFLKNYRELATERKWKQPLLVALAYSAQIMEEGIVPVTSSDVPVDALVSPSGVIAISPAALETI